MAYTYQFRFWYWRKRSNGKPPRKRIVTVLAGSHEKAAEIAASTAFGTRWHPDCFTWSNDPRSPGREQSKGYHNGLKYECR